MITNDWSRRVLPHSPLEALAPGLWQVTGTLLRNPLPRNMVVWRTPEGGLLIHSGVCLDDDQTARLDALGEVTHVVVPCRMHRSDAPAFAARYPGAKVLAPACAKSAVEEVTAVHATCEDALPELGVTMHTPKGLAPFELHYELPLEGERRALVMTDALFNLAQAPPRGVGGFMMKLMGSVGPLGITRIGRTLMLKDKEAFRSHLTELAALPGLVALCVGHGAAVTEDVAGALKDAAGRV